MMSTQDWWTLALYVVLVGVWAWMIWDWRRRRRPPALNCRRNKVGAWLANAALKMTTLEYRAFIRGSIEYGMRSAARDQNEGREAPDDWRPALPGSEPYPVVERVS